MIIEMLPKKSLNIWKDIVPNSISQTTDRMSGPEEEFNFRIYYNLIE